MQTLERIPDEQLARCIIQETGQEYRYGTGRKRRIAAPSGAAIVF